MIELLKAAQKQTGVVNRIVFGRVVNVGHLGDVKAFFLAPERLGQLAPPVVDEKNLFSAARFVGLSVQLIVVHGERRVALLLLPLLFSARQALLPQLINDSIRQIAKRSHTYEGIFRHGIYIRSSWDAGRSRHGRPRLLLKGPWCAETHLALINRQRVESGRLLWGRKTERILGGFILALVRALVVRHLSVQFGLGRVDVHRRPLAKGVKHASILVHQAHQNGREGRPLEIKQSFGECRRRCLDASLVGRVDLQIVPVCRVQPQEATPGGTVLRVHQVPEQRSKGFGLLSPCVGEHAAVFQNEQSLDHRRLWIVVNRTLQRLELDFPVDARKLPALLQNRLDDPKLFPRLLLGLLLRLAHFLQQRPRHVQKLLQGLGAFQLCLLSLGVDILFQQIQ
mmetsp:Transcript_9501/g.25842  ORF Transcript_9501/g.25842 Transcript_9501/m.25842 type:complete len:396 (-) Transcript_9501:1514-2701(-)